MIDLNCISWQSRIYGIEGRSHHLILYEAIMKSIRISDVHYEMLRYQSKKYRMKVEDLVEELIQENYANKKKR